MSKLTQISSTRSGVLPTVTLSLEDPDEFLADYLSDLNLTFDSPLEAVLQTAETAEYPRTSANLVPYKETEQLRFMSPKYEYFAPVSNASRLANPEVVALVIDRAVDRARGIA